MTISVPDVGLWVARLKAEVTEFRFVGKSRDVQTAIDGAIAIPAAFVVPSSGRATDGYTGTGVVTQRVAHTIDVAICVKNVRDARGDAAISDIATIRAQMLTALHGWVPESGLDPVEYVGGQIVNFDDLRMWWVDQFRTYQYFRTI